MAKDKKIKININVIDSPKRKYSVFIGASIIANIYNISDNKDYWITRNKQFFKLLADIIFLPF